MKKALIFIFCLLLASFTYAGSGTSTGVFLKMIPGARPSAMGDAFTAVADDVNAIYVNPAGLIQLKRPEVIASHVLWIEGIANTNFSYVRPSGKNAFGFGVTYMSLGDIDPTDNTGAQTSGGNNSSYNSVVSFVYSIELSGDRLGLGLTAKNIIQKFASYSGNAIAFDFSTLIKINPFSIGLCLQNLSSGISIDGVPNSLPTVFRAGLASEIFSGFKLAGEIDKASDSDMKIHAGTEYAASKSFILRAGFNQVDQFSLARGWTVGIGTKSSLEKKPVWGDEKDETRTGDGMEFDFDYALSTMGEELGNTHKISVTLKFPNPSFIRD